MKKYKFNLINKKGMQEPWTGIFDTKKEADEWFEKYGEFHKMRGHNLIRVKVDSLQE